jgi:hypothetical protein
MLRYGCEDGDPCNTGAYGYGRSPLLTVAGTIDRSQCGDSEASGAAGALRSWVVGWTHRFDPPGARRAGEPNPAGVRRLVEAVVDVLLERRPAEQVKRWVSREVFGLLSTVAQRRAATRFAARSMVRSIRLHAPGPDAVESTVLVQDGPRVRAVALRFERTAAPLNAGSLNAGPPNPGPLAAGAAASGPFTPGVARADQDRLEWRCTALQFA